MRLEAEGHRILKLNIGNPAIFGFDTPDGMLSELVLNLPRSQGYCDAKGVADAREAVASYYRGCGFPALDIRQIFLGNGVSELVGIALQALLNAGDELLIPAPDFPLWTDTTHLNGACPTHYVCNESANWAPDLADVEAKITPSTRGLVVINPNNPTGAVYDRETLEGLLEIAHRHDLIVFADEIYERIVFDGRQHIPLAALAKDQLVVTFGGLSKAYRAAGLRIGWMVLSGATDRAKDYIDGLSTLAALRLCPNVPGQYAIRAALSGYQSIDDLVAPGGRLCAQRDRAVQWIKQIDGADCVKPQGALYLFLRLDAQRFGILDDERMVLDFLRQEQVLLAQGTAFHWPAPDHVRIIFLPCEEELDEAFSKFARFLETYRQT